MKTKTTYMVTIFLLGILAMTGLASALPTVEYLKINGEKYESGDRLVIELEENIDIKLKLQAENGDEKDLEIEVDILGYEYNDHREISDSTHTFDMDANDTEYKDLSVSIPQNADKDEYDLRVRVGGRTGTSFEGLYRLKVEGVKHSLAIKDVVLSPEGKVKAGRALLGIIRIENFGENTEDSIKVKISIPELGLSAADYIDEVEEEESTTSEELYLRIPSCADPGLYEVVAELQYDEGYETVTKSTTIQVVEGDACEITSPSTGSSASGQTIISLGSTSQEVAQGEGGAVYPLTIKNDGASSKQYIITVNGANDWATTKVSPANTIVLSPGEMKAVYIYVTANADASEGQHMFTVSVKSDSKSEEIPFSANVIASDDNSYTSWASLKKGLVTGLVIIVVLLVLLGLIVGFNKLKNGDDEDDFDEEGKTYY